MKNTEESAGQTVEHKLLWSLVMLVRIYSKSSSRDACDSADKVLKRYKDTKWT
jgi:hypothetical protein